MPDTHRGFNINVFRAEIANNRIARPNLFLVQFVIPIGLTNDGTSIGTARLLEYWCEVAALPGVTLQTYQAQRYGYGNLGHRPLLNVFGEMQIDVLFDEKAQNWDLFSNWLNLIINRNMEHGPKYSTGVINGAVPNELEYNDNYTADISIFTYGQMGQIIKHIVLRDAFPKSIGEVRLAWADNNTIMRLPIQMAYEDWFEEHELPETPTTLPPLK